MLINTYNKKTRCCITLILVIFIFTFTSITFGRGDLLVGYGQFDITPALGTGMPGYFNERKADGILDPLLVKALALTCDDKTIVILAFDLIGLDRSVVNRIKTAIRQKTGILPERVFVHATHTHTGARVSEIEGRLPEQAVSAILKALNNSKPEIRVTLGCAEENSVTFIRRYLMKDGTIRTNPGRKNTNIIRPVGRIDPRVNVLFFHDTKICMVSHGLHCDCVSGSKFSADYPYHLTEAIREELGTDWNVVYLNACCGNINHINVNDKDQRSSYQESWKIGRALAKAAIRAHRTSTNVEIDHINSRISEVKCPIRKIPKDVYEWAINEMQKDSDKSSKRNFNELTPSSIIRLSQTKETYRPAEIIALKIGPVGIVGLPAECFVELSMDIQTHSVTDSTWVIGLTGGSMGYVPHPRGYQEGGYEATYSSARLAPETPMLWCNAAIKMLNELKTEN